MRQPDLVLAARAELDQLSSTHEEALKAVVDLTNERDQLRSAAIAALKPFTLPWLSDDFSSQESWKILITAEELKTARKALKGLEGGKEFPLNNNQPK